MPALQRSMTKRGSLTMNMGAAMTGRGSWASAGAWAQGLLDGR